MDSSVRDLPPEIILIILEYLESPIDVGNCVTACPDLLEELAVRHILGPQLCILASLDTNLKKKLKLEGWSKNSTDNGLIMSIWRKMEIYRGVFTFNQTLVFNAFKMFSNFSFLFR